MLVGDQAEPLVTVIVPCYNSERTIHRCLESIVNQRTSVPFDVIVVDSSSDHTSQIVGSKFPSVRLIRLNKRALAGAARNIGVRATRAQFCFMVDSDCVARPNIIERAVARHLEGNYAAVGGSLRNGTPNSLSGWVSYLIEFKEFMPTVPMRLDKNVPTANLTYRREALERSGYFDEDLWPAEDLLLNWKIHNSGGLILFDPAIEVTHLNRTSWKEVLSHQVKLGGTSAIARKRGGLPGRFLLRYPALISLMPFVRLARAAIWLGKYDRKALMLLLLIWPMYLIAASFWSFGFYKEALKDKEGQ